MCTWKTGKLKSVSTLSLIKKWGECVAGKRQIDPFKSSALLWDITKQCRTRSDITERGV